MRIRDLAAADLPHVLELNNSATPAVSLLDDSALGRLVEMASVLIVTAAPSDGRPVGTGGDGSGDEADPIVGFALSFGPGAAYQSVNYRYFADRLTDFHYLDRIVVDPAWHRRGIGSALYDEVERRCGAAVLTCEVNVRPPNEGSMAFHRHRGFRQVGTQDTEGGAKTVALLEKPLTP